MRKWFFVFVILVLFIFVSSLLSASSVSTIGFKDIYLGDSKELVLEKVNGYNLNYDLSQVSLDSERVDPYLLMSKEFAYRYTPSYLLFDIDGSSYYVDFRGIDFFHSDFSVSFRGDIFVLYYSRLSNLVISGDDLSLFNPYLKELSFHLFDNSVYEINYSLGLSLSELERFLSNLSSLYGKFKFSKFGSLVIFEFLYEGVVIKLSMSESTFSSLGHLNLVGRESFLNRKVSVSVSDVRGLKELSKYRRDVYDNMLDMFNQKAQSYLSELMSVLERSRRRGVSIDRDRDKERYRYIDELSG